VEGSAKDFDFVEVFADPSTASAEPAFEGSNVFRVAALSTILGGDRQLAQDMTSDLLALGFSPGLSSGEGGWSDTDPAESFAGSEDRPSTRDTPAGNRVALWQRVNEAMTPRSATAFLLAVLGSRLERESTAAAAALWRQISMIDRRDLPLRYWRPYFWEWLYELRALGLPEPAWWPALGTPSSFPNLDLDVDDFEATEWEPDTWNAIYERAMALRGSRYDETALVSFLTLFRLNAALRSRDRIVRSLASAAFLPSGSSDDTPASPRISRPNTHSGTLVSTMVHGTRAYLGNWWRPEGTFFRFIQQPYRPNLYTGGARFSWSGKWSKRHRERAGREFHEWTEDEPVAHDGLQTVFAHSYGGEIAARAANAGAPIDQLILLSVPVTAHVEAAAQAGMPIVDVRLKRDPVLMLARTRDRLTQHIQERANVKEVILEQWSIDHGASHKREAWQIEEVARKGAI